METSKKRAEELVSAKDDEILELTRIELTKVGESKSKQIEEKDAEIKDKTKTLRKKEIELNTVKKLKEKKGTLDMLEKVNAKNKRLEDSKKSHLATIASLKDKIKEIEAGSRTEYIAL